MAVRNGHEESAKALIMAGADGENARKGFLAPKPAPFFL